VQESVRGLLAKEQETGVDKFSYYEDFSTKVQNIRKNMRDLLWSLKAKGETIAAYGAAAKGTIMLNYIGAGLDVIDFVVDRNIHKQGKYMPGVHIPVCEPARLMEDKPDYVVILPWNFMDEILCQQAAFRTSGGKFINPIPQPVIV